MTETKKKPFDLKSRISRRDFLRKAGAGVVLGATAGAIPFGSSLAFAQGSWTHEADVVVVGSGAAAFSAAITAASHGSQVIMIEKAPVTGGTTARSGAGYWIPNNADLRAQGVVDDREDCLRYMARYSYPHFYNPDAPNLGLPQDRYDLLAAFYDNASPAVEYLGELGALRSVGGPAGMPDYAEHLPENKVSDGRRSMYVQTESGQQGSGVEMIQQLQAWAEANGVEILTGHAASRIVQNGKGDVIGVEATTLDGREVTLRARKGVIFGSGGFSNNRAMVLDHLPFGTYGGCGVPTNTGDFVHMATAAGARLGNMNGAFRLEVVLDHALESSSIPADIWQPPGDSMIYVNKFGKRVVNEKRPYNERARVHFTYDPSTADYPNQLLFMIWDQRTAELYENNFPIPALDSNAPYVLRADSLTELATKIDAHIDMLRPKTGPIASVGPVELSPDFAANLEETIETYNRYAEAGVDEEFGRGSLAYDLGWHANAFSIPKEDTGHEISEKNITMYPLSGSGPYYATIVVAGNLDTNGGPAIDANGQVVSTDDEPITGLYGAGNCVASPTAHAYWGAGSTLGPALTFRYLAGKHAAGQPDNDEAAS